MLKLVKGALKCAFHLRILRKSKLYSVNLQKDLMPPSRFTFAAQTSASVRGVHNQPGVESWSSAAGPGVSSPAAVWLAVSRAQGEVLELRKENQRLMMLQGDSLRGRSRSTDSNGR